MGPSHTHHFTPSEPAPTSLTIMTKVWTYHSLHKAKHQLQILTDIQSNQSRHDCKIVCLHRQEIDQGQCHKIIAAFEYPSRSLRQEIIQRRKKGRIPAYLTQKQLQNILNLAAVFIINHYSHMCTHTDLLSNIFLHGQSFKMCHPELLPCNCRDDSCSKEGLSQKMLDLILEMLLLEKVVKGGRKEVQKGQYLYSHSIWLGNLLERMLDSKSDLLTICKDSKYSASKQQRETLQNFLYTSQNNNQSNQKQTKTSFLAEFIPEMQPEHSPQINEFKIAQETKASNSNRIRYYSHLSQFQAEKQKKFPTLNDLYAQKKESQRMLLDKYQQDLAQSIGDPEQHFGNSIILSPPVTTKKLKDSDNIIDNVQMVQTHNVFLIQPLKIDEDSHSRTSRSIIKSYIPATIVEEQHEQEGNSNSQQTSKIQSDQSQFQIFEQDGYHYQGQVMNGKKHGKGVFVYPNGVQYQGDWVEDQMEGIGSLYYPSGKPYYRGQWKSGNFHGRGIFYNDQPEQIVGGFNFRDFSNVGKKWHSFQGTFKHDKKHGQGLLTLSNGQTMLAQWRSDIIQGRGQFCTLEGHLIRGIWIENTLYLENS